MIRRMCSGKRFVVLCDENRNVGEADDEQQSCGEHEDVHGLAPFERELRGFDSVR